MDRFFVDVVVAISLFFSLFHPLTIWYLDLQPAYQIPTTFGDQIESRFNAVGTYSQTLTVHWVKGKESSTHVFVKKQYQVLHVYSSTFDWDDKTYTKKLNKKVILEDSSKGLYYRTKTGEWYFQIIHGVFGNFKVTNLFKGKKVGDEFPVKMTLVYSFDEGKERTQILEYTARKEKWTDDLPTILVIIIALVLVIIAVATFRQWRKW